MAATGKVATGKTTKISGNLEDKHETCRSGLACPDRGGYDRLNRVVR